VLSDFPEMAHVHDAAQISLLHYILLYTLFGADFLLHHEDPAFNRLIEYADQVPESTLQHLRKGEWDQIDFVDDIFRIVTSARIGFLLDKREYYQPHLCLGALLEFQEFFPKLFEAMGYDPQSSQSPMRVSDSIHSIAAQGHALPAAGVGHKEVTIAKAMLHKIAVDHLKAGGQLWANFVFNPSPKVTLNTTFTLPTDTTLKARLTTIEKAMDALLR
jgi:hypothetical protein